MESAWKEPENLTNVGSPLPSGTLVVCPLLPPFSRGLCLLMSSVTSEILPVLRSLLSVGFIKSKQYPHRAVFIRTTRQPRVPSQGGFSLLLPPTAIWLAPPAKVFLRTCYMILSSVALPDPSAEQGEEEAC